MFAESLTDGIRDAGVEPTQIEVGHVGNFVADLFAGQGLIGGFFGQVFPELAMLPTSRHEAACASGSMAILGAMRDIEAGHYEEHLKYTPFFHGKAKSQFVSQIRRDNDKLNFCKLNNIPMVEVYPKDEINKELFISFGITL